MEQRVELYQRRRRLRQEWGWRRRAANGRIIATDHGQGYVNRQDALDGALLAMTPAPVYLVDPDDLTMDGAVLWSPS